MIRIVEVGPRDGLQNEAVPIPTEAKAAFIRRLFAAGLREIEFSSFVSPKWVPQLGDAEDLWTMLEPEIQAGALALVPNQKGFERAEQLGVRRIAVFTAASDAFTQKNIRMSVEESIQGFQGFVPDFRSSGGFVRAYVSTAFECPYAGRIAPERVVEVCQMLDAMGVDELSLGDTIGAAGPAEVDRLTTALLAHFPAERLTYHFHDTRGTAIANVAAALRLGIRSFDSSAAGLGGCPYAPGAGGNLATDDLVYFLEREGHATGVDAAQLASASLPILEALGRAPMAKAQLAKLAQRDASLHS